MNLVLVPGGLMLFQLMWDTGLAGRLLKSPNKRLALLFEDRLKLKLSLSTNCYGRTN